MLVALLLLLAEALAADIAIISCDIVVAGGSTASLAAALTAADVSGSELARSLARNAALCRPLPSCACASRTLRTGLAASWCGACVSLTSGGASR
jgi:hypothetical protein